MDFEEGVDGRVIPIEQLLEGTLSEDGIEDGARLYRLRHFRAEELGRLNDGSDWVWPSEVDGLVRMKE